jgi:prepilin-type N-terminal cleavage/methylation domain-containing protein
MGDERGYTIMELVIVIVIIGVLAGVASSGLLDQPRFRLDVTRKRIQTDLAYAREIAIQMHEPVSAKFNVAGNSYQIYVSSTGSPLTDPLNRSQNLSFSINGQSNSAGVALSAASIAGTPGLRFNSWGSPTDSSGATQATSTGNIILTSGSYTDTVRVEPKTGFVR